MRPAAPTRRRRSSPPRAGSTIRRAESSKGAFVRRRQPPPPRETRRGGRGNDVCHLDVRNNRYAAHREGRLPGHRRVADVVVVEDLHEREQVARRRRRGHERAIEVIGRQVEREGPVPGPARIGVGVRVRPKAADVRRIGYRRLEQHREVRSVHRARRVVGLELQMDLRRDDVRLDRRQSVVERKLRVEERQRERRHVEASHDDFCAGRVAQGREHADSKRTQQTGTDGGEGEGTHDGSRLTARVVEQQPKVHAVLGGWVDRAPPGRVGVEFGGVSRAIG